MGNEYKNVVTYKPGANPEDIKLAIASIDNYAGVSHGKYDFWEIYPQTSIRQEMTRKEYSGYRPSESMPRGPKETRMACMEAYRKVGIIKNAIDLMTDFAVQGIQLTHPNPQIQKFFRGWFKKAGGPDRSERFVSCLLRSGMAAVRRTFSKINVKHEQYLRSLGVMIEPDKDVEPHEQVRSRVYPSNYTILNPLAINTTGGELAQFVGEQIYSINVTPMLRNQIAFPQNDAERALVAKLPKDIIDAIVKKNSQVIPLDPSRLRVFFYKKDDWESSADPLILSILSDVILLEKMQLADLAALDGVISQVRIWKLGSLEKEIFPGPAIIAKLYDILLSNPGGGAFDIIWGPDIDVQTIETTVHQFLGQAKYEPVLNNIYAGLGIPPTLTGSANASGFTNNYISLKTLIQRLEYVRSVLTAFWEQEIELVRQAMGFRFPAKVRFDRMILSDEASEKALMIQLVDRGLMSFETLQERFGEDAELEELRLRREKKDRERGTLVPQAGPWFDAEKEYQLRKIALQRTLISPHDSGIDIVEQYKKAPFLMQLDSAAKAKAAGGGIEKTSGVPSQGRPKNSKDSSPRTRSETTPRRTAATVDDYAELLTLSSWARYAQAEITEIIISPLLKIYDKKNVRSLSAKESDEVESLRFLILSNLKPYSSINIQTIKQIIDNSSTLDINYKTLYNSLYAEALTKHNNKPITLEETRAIQAAVYAILNFA